MDLKQPVYFRYSHEGTMYAETPVIGYGDLSLLVDEAEKSRLRRARICTHGNDSASLHQMVICMFRDSLVPIHRHERDEIFTIERGYVSVRFFDENCEHQKTYSLSTETFFNLRIPAGQWHDVTVDGEYAIYIETTTGPWTKESMEVWRAS